MWVKYVLRYKASSTDYIVLSDRPFLCIIYVRYDSYLAERL